MILGLNVKSIIITEVIRTILINHDLLSLLYIALFYYIIT